MINDPAAPQNAEVRRVYPCAEFKQRWLADSGDLAYLISTYD